MLVFPSTLSKQTETGLRFVSVCVWHVIWRWQMVLVTASAVANRLPRRHCSQGLFWWGGAPKGDRVTTHSSPSHGSAKPTPPSPFSPHFLSLSRLSISSMKYNKHHSLLYSQIHSCASTEDKHSYSVACSCSLSDTHTYIFFPVTQTPQWLCSRFLCIERVLTDVEAVVWRRHGAEKGLGDGGGGGREGGKHLPPTARQPSQW